MITPIDSATQSFRNRFEAAQKEAKIAAAKADARVAQRLAEKAWRTV